MRVAVVRGPNLNPWELANFPPDVELVAFGSRRGTFDAHALRIESRRLVGPADVVGRLPALGQGLVRRLAGPLDHLVGLERALRGFDIAHVAELNTAYSRQALRARSSGAVRRVVATVWENIPLPAAENMLVARRTRVVAAQVDYCIAISERARLHLRLAGVPDERIEVLPMGVDVERFAPAAAADDRRDGRMRILCVSRLVSEKGVEDLVVALRLLSERDIDAEVTLVGDGPLRGRLQAMAAELGVQSRLRLEGTVSYDALPDLYRRSDVFVLASAPRATWREQFGFAVVEAMACGMPVLAGASGSLDEVVGDPEQLVRPHDPAALAAALAALAADPARGRAPGRAQRRLRARALRPPPRRGAAARALRARARGA